MSASEEMGRFSFDGAENIAFWVSDHDPELEHNLKVMFDELPVLLEFLKYNFPGLFKVPALDGATNEPAPEYMLSNAGEFAARWNTLTPEQREALWKAMSGACNDGYQCHVKDHEGMEHQFGVQARKLDHAKSELQGLLDSLDSHITHDEIYSAIQAVREAL